MKDKFNREIDYLRISLIESCNLRCIYCMPEKEVPFKGKKLLTLEELRYIIEIFTQIGLKKIRFTGGEPLLRKDLLALTSFAKEKGIEKIALTTNGILLGKALEDLIASGVNEINISLDSLKEEVYKKITRGGKLKDVISSIEKALEKGIKVKINSVIVKGINEEDFIPLCNLSLRYNLDLRFIELMPIGEGIKFIGVSGKTLEERLKANFRVEEVKRERYNGPASYYKIAGGKGRIGFISPLSNHFCNSCNRIRITSDGVLKQCLHFERGLDLKELLREGVSREELSNKIRETIYNKPEGHRFIEEKKGEDNRFMFQIGG